MRESEGFEGALGPGQDPLPGSLATIRSIGLASRTKPIHTLNQGACHVEPVAVAVTLIGRLTSQRDNLRKREGNTEKALGKGCYPLLAPISSRDLALG